jgi:DNA-binding MarR family transcriptional regulator
MDEVRFARHEESVRAMVRDLAGGVDLRGLELVRQVKMVANLYDEVTGEHRRECDLSGARWRLLLRLWGEEAHGNCGGTSPTHLSRCQNVSKNTISALLRGLEEQGLVERALDVEDRRVFRMRLTEAGRQLVQTSAPQHLAHLNRLASGLTADEQAQLTTLLEKLYASLASHVPAALAAASAAED